MKRLLNILIAAEQSLSAVVVGWRYVTKTIVLSCRYSRDKETREIRRSSAVSTVLVWNKASRIRPTIAEAVHMRS